MRFCCIRRIFENSVVCCSNIYSLFWILTSIEDHDIPNYEISGLLFNKLQSIWKKSIDPFAMMRWTWLQQQQWKKVALFTFHIDWASNNLNRRKIVLFVIIRESFEFRCQCIERYIENGRCNWNWALKLFTERSEIREWTTIW